MSNYLRLFIKFEERCCPCVRNVTSLWQGYVKPSPVKKVNPDHLLRIGYHQVGWINLKIFPKRDGNLYPSDKFLSTRFKILINFNQLKRFS